MKPRAIIYCSKHGSTKRIANMLGNKYALPVINIDHITGYSFQNVPVMYCGWIKKGKIQGLSKAKTLFACAEIVAVGCYEANEATRLKIKYANEIDKPIFTYVQSKPDITPSTLEKIWITLFQPSLLKHVEEKEMAIKHEYTI